MRSPRIPTFMLRRVLPAEVREEVLRDLDDRYEDLCRWGGRWAASRWYWAQALRAVGPAAKDRMPRHTRTPVARRTRERLESVVGDITLAFRAFRRSPGIIAVAVISLALGIGANTAIFSVVDTFMFRPLSFTEPERLVHVYATLPERGWNYNEVSIANFVDFREQSRTTDIAASYARDFNLSSGDGPERINGERASWNYFRVLGVQPVHGRTFTADEEQRGQHHVAIVSNGLWRRRFGAAPSLVGQTVQLDGEQYTVVGILPPTFRWYGSNTEIWTPFGLAGDESRGSNVLKPIGRLRPDATLEQANTELSGIARRLEGAYPESNRGWGAGVQGLHGLIFPEQFETGSLILTVAVAFVLLITCANVANLMLTRVVRRGREIALRRALGAGRGRIVRQLLTEAMIVSVFGGVVGVVGAYIAVPVLAGLLPGTLPRVEDIGVDGRVLSFALVVTLLTGVLVGIAPVFHSSRSNITDALREGGRSAVGVRGVGLRKLLVVSEVTLAMTLLVASVLLVKAFWRVQTMDYGWGRENVLTFRVSLPEAQYESGETVTGFYRELLSRLASDPAALAVSGTTIPPLQGNTNTFFGVPGRETPSIQQRPLTEFRFVFPGYFETMGIPVLRGRGLGDQDRPTTQPVVVINEILADRYWPGENPVGRQVRFWGETREIVGVVRNTLDVRHYAEPMMFMSAFQYPRRDMGLLIRTVGEPSSAVELARATVADLAATLPIYDVRTMEEAISERWGGETVVAKIMGCLAVVALLLAVAGVYGVISYMVSQRIREMGIRMALGAERVTVLRMVLRQGATLTVTGVAIGILIASFVTRSLSFFLLGVNPYDLTTFGTVALALCVAGVAGAYLPARRATKADPLDVLRAE